MRKKSLHKSCSRTGSRAIRADNTRNGKAEGPPDPTRLTRSKTGPRDAIRRIRRTRDKGKRREGGKRVCISKHVHTQKEAMSIHRERTKSCTRNESVATVYHGLTDAWSVYVIIQTAWIQKQGRGLNYHNTKSKGNVLNWLKIKKMMGRVHWVRALSRDQLFATLWTTAPQSRLSRGFSRQEHWSGWPFPSPGDLPDPEIEPPSLATPALASGFFATGKPKDTLLIFKPFPSWILT